MIAGAVFACVPSSHTNMHPAQRRRGQLVGRDDRWKDWPDVHQIVLSNYVLEVVLNPCVRHHNIIAL